MKIKVISTQNKDENNNPPYYVQDTGKMPETYLPQYLNYLKTNQTAGLLKWEVIEQ